jgi:hypothetical protein
VITQFRQWVRDIIIVLEELEHLDSRGVGETHVVVGVRSRANANIHAMRGARLGRAASAFEVGHNKRHQIRGHEGRVLELGYCPVVAVFFLTKKL